MMQARRAGGEKTKSGYYGANHSPSPSEGDQERAQRPEGKRRTPQNGAQRVKLSCIVVLGCGCGEVHSGELLKMRLIELAVSCPS